MFDTLCRSDAPNRNPSFKRQGLTMRHIARLTLLLFVYTSVVTSPYAQNLYKSVGPDGVVVYSDQPPTDSKNVKAMNFEDLPITVLPTFNLPSTPPTVIERIRKLWDSLAAKVSFTTKAPSKAGVVLYTASWCGYCKQAKAYLEGKGIKYQEIDIDTKDGKVAFAQAGGGKGVPLIVAAGQNVHGYTPAAYDALFAK